MNNILRLNIYKKYVSYETFQDLDSLLEALDKCKEGAFSHIIPAGFMTMAPFTDDKELVRAAFAEAEKIGAKAQYKRAVAGGNDAGIIHKSNGGIRTLAISLACRYLHAPNCVADKADCESVMKLAHKLAEIIAGGEL